MTIKSLNPWDANEKRAWKARDWQRKQENKSKVQVNDPEEKKLSVQGCMRQKTVDHGGIKRTVKQREEQHRAEGLYTAAAD